MHRQNKERKLKERIDIATKRWAVQDMKRERRDLKPGEFEQKRKTFIESAKRVDKHKLSEVFNE